MDIMLVLPSDLNLLNLFFRAAPFSFLSSGWLNLRTIGAQTLESRG
jgi:hypothetical protein